MKEILAGIALLLIAIIDMIQSAFIYAGCSTLIGIIINPAIKYISYAA